MECGRACPACFVLHRRLGVACGAEAHAQAVLPIPHHFHSNAEQSQQDAVPGRAPRGCKSWPQHILVRMFAGGTVCASLLLPEARKRALQESRGTTHILGQVLLQAVVVVGACYAAALTRPTGIPVIGRVRRRRRPPCCPACQRHRDRATSSNLMGAVAARAQPLGKGGATCSRRRASRGAPRTPTATRSR